MNICSRSLAAPTGRLSPAALRVPRSALYQGNTIQPQGLCTCWSLSSTHIPFLRGFREPYIVRAERAL